MREATMVLVERRQREDVRGMAAENRYCTGPCRSTQLHKVKDGRLVCQACKLEKHPTR